MNIIKNTILLSVILSLVGCGGSSSDGTTTAPTNTINTNSEVVNTIALKVDNLVVKVHENTFDTTGKMLLDLNKTLSSFERMSNSVTDTIDNSMKLLDALAKPFKIADAYVGSFSTTSNYTATTPAFVLQATIGSSSAKYFLVSSDSSFFIPGKTVKSYFFDGSSLSSAWARAISSADTSKDLYLNLLELDSNGFIQKISNNFIIKSTKLKSL